MNLAGFLVVVLSFVIAAGGVFTVCRYAHRLQLLQLPNQRSSHQCPTPAGGGLGIVLAGTLAGLLSPDTAGLVGLALPLAVVGFVDDRRPVPVSLRLVVQWLSVAGCWLWAGGSLPDWAIPSWSAAILLCLVGVWWLNVFNFMDGIDGLAGSQAVFMLAVGAGLSALLHPTAVFDSVWLLMVCLVAACVGFLGFNWPPAKIFMGDVGSVWLGLMIFILALLTVQKSWLNESVWLILAALFISDATVTLLVRCRRGGRWFAAHRSHAYQRLSRRYGGHRPVTMMAIAVNGLWLAPLAGFCVVLPNWSLLWLLLAYLPVLIVVRWAGAGLPDKA